ncbi:MAG: CRISPR-associated endonuclease Cas2 [Casimicrobiaceae bacterium]|nr:CRISPR-associated endonuclease Cas2 [Casimicrobiaceae bacterium]
MARETYVIAYDISDDRERARLDRLLAGYGFRAQYSVYECELTRGEKLRLYGQIEALGLQTGHVRIYRIHPDRTKTLGAAPPERLADAVAFIV